MIVNNLKWADQSSLEVRSRFWPKPTKALSAISLCITVYYLASSISLPIIIQYHPVSRYVSGVSCGIIIYHLVSSNAYTLISLVCLLKLDQSTSSVVLNKEGRLKKPLIVNMKIWLSFLKEQIKEKDDQIRDLRKLLDQEQQLHALADKKVAELENRYAQSGFWGWLTSFFN